MCPSCWELRSRSAAALNTTGNGSRLQTVGLVMGVVALVPGCWILQIISIIVNIVAIAKAKGDKARKARRRPIAGLVLSGIGLIVTIALALNNSMPHW
jgi:hypothetical protein